MNRFSERNSMLRQVDANNLSHINKQQAYNQHKRMVNDLTRQQIEMKGREANMNRQNEKMNDKQMIDYDNMKAMEYRDQMRNIKASQQHIMASENLN